MAVSAKLEVWGREQVGRAGGSQLPLSLVFPLLFPFPRGRYVSVIPFHLILHRKLFPRHQEFS